MRRVCTLVSQKLVLVGGHPKGYSEPFSRETHSGKILHSILDDLHIKPVLIDIYTDESAEKRDYIEPQIIEKLKALSGFCKIVALGRFVYVALLKRGIHAIYLPHPASRGRYVGVLKRRLEILALGGTPCECTKCGCGSWLDCERECRDGCCKESFPT